MKRAIKIIVPILLSLVILLSIGWYLFEYDPEFTRDMLLQQARRLEDDGKHSAAVWFYDLAYRQADDNDNVAIELAQQYKAIGNYTKAEYTLSKAIEDGGSLELYIALCQTFVEQNKLLDAVQMLDKVGNPDIKQQLDALRPAAPVASEEPGFYSQYLNIALEVDAGALYYSMDQEYPSIPEDAYAGPISLGAGDTVIWAICIGENGLVSLPAMFTYTIGNVVEEVTFADSAFEKAVRELLEVEEDRSLYSNELWTITEFSLPENAATCQDLRWLPNLTSLTIADNVIDTLDALASMHQLSTVTITDSVISTRDLAQIAAVPGLTRLTLSGCGISNIEDLAPAKELSYLDLTGNTVRDTTALLSMTKLEELYLGNNALVSLSDIATLTELTVLDISYNSLVSTAPLSSMTGLTSLNISGNNLMILEGIEPLTNLVCFYAAHNQLVDVDVLSGCKSLEKLDISNNNILNIDIITDLVKLCQLDFSHNEVSVLPSFQSGCPLTIINGAYNQLSSLKPLGNLAELQYVYMDYNEALQSIEALAKCKKLEVVNVYGTKVSYVSVLTNLGVEVNYNPV